jgi:hypothetical protein
MFCSFPRGFIRPCSAPRRSFSSAFQLFCSDWRFFSLSVKCTKEDGSVGGIGVTKISLARVPPPHTQTEIAESFPSHVNLHKRISCGLTING